jgi:hypothetical protein
VSHIIYRLKNSVSDEHQLKKDVLADDAFRQIFSDILNIARISSRKGTQNFSDLSSGRSEVNGQPMRYCALGGQFITINIENQIESILLKIWSMEK